MVGSWGMIVFAIGSKNSFFRGKIDLFLEARGEGFIAKFYPSLSLFLRLFRPNIKYSFLTLTFGKQISNLITIYLQRRYLHLYLLLQILLNPLHLFFNKNRCSRQYSIFTFWPFHCMCLPSPRLPIGKDTDILAIQGLLNERHNILENWGLGGTWREDAVEMEELRVEF